MTSLESLLSLIERERAIADKATKGDWVCSYEMDEERICRYDVSACEDGDLICSLEDVNFENNQRFIAHSRTIVPRALSALRVMAEALNTAKQDFQSLTNAKDKWSTFAETAKADVEAALAMAVLILEGE